MSDSPAAISQDAVLEKLKNVIDPELFVNIVDLGLIYEIVVDGEKSADEEADAGDTPPPDNTETNVHAAAEPASDAASEGSYIKIDMTMTSPACPAGPQLVQQSKMAIERLDDVDEAEIKLTLSPPWTPERMTDDARDQLGIF